MHYVVENYETHHHDARTSELCPIIQYTTSNYAFMRPQVKEACTWAALYM